MGKHARCESADHRPTNNPHVPTDRGTAGPRDHRTHRTHRPHRTAGTTRAAPHRTHHPRTENNENT